MLTPRKIDYTELQKVKKFPILRRGRYGGGLIIEQENRRVNPLGMLALRTLGGLNKGAFGGVHGLLFLPVSKRPALSGCLFRSALSSAFAFVWRLNAFLPSVEDAYSVQVVFV